MDASWALYMDFAGPSDQFPGPGGRAAKSGARLESASPDWRRRASRGWQRWPTSSAGRCTACLVGGLGRSTRVKITFTCRIATL